MDQQTTFIIYIKIKRKKTRKMNQYTNNLKNVKDIKPLVHHITNYVSVNDCANITLSIGASPLMADDIKEVAQIVSISSVLVLNIGTLNQRTILAMIKAGERANQLDIPVVLDPVGVGASELRDEAISRILNRVKITVLRGNISEISFIAGLNSKTKGVDASEQDIKRNDNKVEIARNLAKKLDCIVAITGEIDVISNSEKSIEIHNGVEQLAKVTGTGCMLTSLIAACLAANKDDYLSACATAISVMGIAGEISLERNIDAGLGSFHIGIIDAVSKIDEVIFNEKCKINEIKH
ncbi:hydroxyethylthiazole kinase [Mycoplasma sp. P36-A1]|uniref:hydroxyethylthiazole kinase n=1 Tax=Mycoplasma sp. P36-A1 TaxID=3252900 RepID=UPI003C2BBA3C